MTAKIITSRIDPHPEAPQQAAEKFYTLVVDGVEICGDRESAFYGIRDAAFSLAHSASIILKNGMTGADVDY